MRKAILTQSGVEYVDLTPEEVTAREAEEAQAQAEATAKEEARVAQEATDAQTAIDKASAKAKLIAAEYAPLTEAEADTIVL